MKKLLLFLISLIFLAVSCGGSKKTENVTDNDILPDEDAADFDGTEENNDEETEDEEEYAEEDAGAAESIHCDANPCENFANVDGTCTDREEGGFECGCAEGYFWANPGCRKITYASICTGQKQCYNRDVSMTCSKEGEDFYGQDRHYAEKGTCIPKNFSSTIAAGSEEITLDNNLKIAWMRKLADSDYSWDEAVKYCDELEYKGFKDWRLPSPKELMFTAPLLNPQKYLWSSQAKQDSYAWKIHVNSRYLSTAEKSETNSVRCVRGGQKEVSVLFETIGKDLVLDHINSFFWNTAYTGAKSWMDALAYCENSTHAGFSDWRLPNINELLSLVNFKKENPASNFPYAGNNFRYDAWWSSTTQDVNTSYAIYALSANIFTGEISNVKKYEQARVICVRSEPCEKGYFLSGKECVKSPCSDNSCKNFLNSDGKCFINSMKSFSCGCTEKYFWDGKKCVNPCDKNPCKKFLHSDQKCEPIDAFRYSCGCTGNYRWWNEENGCVEKEPGPGNVCTGQSGCYDNDKEIECQAEEEDFFGQDAQYAGLGVCIPQSFSVDKSVRNEPVVIDNNTGLEWQQKLSKPITSCFSYSYPCEEAFDYCENLSYGGHDDWRLPTILELHSIVDSEKVNPAINTYYFPDTPPEYFISSSFVSTSWASGGPHDPLATDSTSSHWGVDFSIGISKTASFMVQNYVRCVRGEQLPEKTFDVLVGSNKKDPEIAFNSKGTLIWQAGTKSYGWENALKYCEKLDLGGLSNWRLPNKNELLEYFTPCYGYSSSYYVGYWYETYPSSFHWSSTTVYDKPEKAWIVDYGDCRGDAHYDNYRDKTDSSYIYTRCVTDNPCSGGTIWNGEVCIKENPCEPNPCAAQAYSTGNCIVSAKEKNGYYCECSEKSFWNSDEKECLRTCEGNPCSSYSHSDGECHEEESGRFYCGCEEPFYWNFKSHRCTRNCDSNPCPDTKKSTDECYDDETEGFRCGCIEGYVWVSGSSCREDLCTPNPCTGIANSDGICTVSYSSYSCGCAEGYSWNSQEKSCVEGDDGWNGE